MLPREQTSNFNEACIDHDKERADRRETGRGDLHHHEGRERDLRGREDLRDEDELRVQPAKKSFGPVRASAKPVRLGLTSR
jgi:hypothetical protein